MARNTDAGGGDQDPDTQLPSGPQLPEPPTPTPCPDRWTLGWSGGFVREAVPQSTC